jgi:hypothetical protein
VAAKETPIHQKVAEAVVAKLPKKLRDKMTLTVKSSYTAIGDEDGWIVRLTPKILEASKKRLTEEQLDSSGLHGGNKPMHRPHHLGLLLAATSMEPGEARTAAETELTGGGLEEVAHAVEVGAKPLAKKTAVEKAHTPETPLTEANKKAAAKAAAKGEQGKGESK